MYVSEQSYVLQKCHDALLDWMRGVGDAQHVALQEIVLELVTGRTHQLRGQLHGLQRHPLLQGERAESLRDFHIAGDRLYQGITSLDAEDGSRSCPHLALQVIAFVGINSFESILFVYLLLFSMYLLYFYYFSFLQSYSMSVRANLAGGQQEFHFEINSPWWQPILDSATLKKVHGHVLIL